MQMQINRVVVVGAGQMGRGIAQVFAAAGKSVTVCDINDQIIAASEAALDKFGYKKGKKYDRSRLNSRVENLRKYFIQKGFRNLDGIVIQTVINLMVIVVVNYNSFVMKSVERVAVNNLHQVIIYFFHFDQQLSRC